MKAMLAEAEAKVAAAKEAELRAQEELARIRAMREQASVAAASDPSTVAAASMDHPSTVAAGNSTHEAPRTEAASVWTSPQIESEYASTHDSFSRALLPAGLSARFTALCDSLAPAVAVRPAPARSLSAGAAVEMSPWQWADSPAQLTFNPDGIQGALMTPWGEGRWGSLPRQPGLLWANFAHRSHIVWVMGARLLSHRCGDNETVVVTSVAPSRAVGQPTAEPLARARALFVRLTTPMAAHAFDAACTAAPSVARQARCAQAVQRRRWGWVEGGRPSPAEAATLIASSGGLACISSRVAPARVHVQASGDGSSAVGARSPADRSRCAMLRWACVADWPSAADSKAAPAEVLVLNATASGPRQRQILVQRGDEAVLMPCLAPEEESYGMWLAWAGQQGSHPGARDDDEEEGEAEDET